MSSKRRKPPTDHQIKKHIEQFSEAQVALSDGTFLDTVRTLVQTRLAANGAPVSSVTMAEVIRYAAQSAPVPGEKGARKAFLNGIRACVQYNGTGAFYPSVFGLLKKKKSSTTDLYLKYLSGEKKSPSVVTNPSWYHCIAPDACKLCRAVCGVAIELGYSTNFGECATLCAAVSLSVQHSYRFTYAYELQKFEESSPRELSQNEADAMYAEWNSEAGPSSEHQDDEVVAPRPRSRKRRGDKLVERADDRGADTTVARVLPVGFVSTSKLAPSPNTDPTVSTGTPELPAATSQMIQSIVDGFMKQWAETQATTGRQTIPEPSSTEDPDEVLLAPSLLSEEDSEDEDQYSIEPISPTMCVSDSEEEG
jgi:hypothetical protein